MWEQETTLLVSLKNFNFNILVNDEYLFSEGFLSQLFKMHGVFLLGSSQLLCNLP